jgi:hypothetical protein
MQASGATRGEKAKVYLLFEVLLINKFRRPGQASKASADPGPIRCGGHNRARWWTTFSQQFAPVVMGPGSEAGTTSGEGFVRNDG